MQKSKLASLIPLIIAAIIVAIALLLPYVVKIAVTLDETKLTVQSLTTEIVVNYKDITQLQLLDSIPSSSRVFGIGSGTLNLGKFSNTTYGTYQRATANNELFIVIRDKTNKYYVFNVKDVEQTRAIYEQLLASVPKQ